MTKIFLIAFKRYGVDGVITSEKEMCYSARSYPTSVLPVPWRLTRHNVTWRTNIESSITT
jgi:hypothetical protein